MITLHSKIKVRRTGVDKDGNPISQIVDCTLGRILFNEIILQDLGFVDRSKPENALAYEIDFHVGKKQLKQILDKCINIHGADVYKRQQTTLHFIIFSRSFLNAL